MNINEVYSGSYLKADDLQGRRVTVRINHVSVKDFEGDKGVERKIIVGFEGKDKCLVCNKTNATTIAEMHGPDTNGWINKTIQMEARKVEFSGRLVPAVRVVLQEQSSPVADAPTPKPRQAKPAPVADDPGYPDNQPVDPEVGF